MANISQKITEFPTPPDRHPPLAAIPPHLVSEERDPAREIRNLIEQLQESTLEARRNQRHAEEECDKMKRRLLEIENRAGPTRGEDSQQKAIAHERDVLLQQQNQYGPVIAELKNKLKSADAGRAEALRQRDLAMQEKTDALESVAAAKRNFAEAQKALAEVRKGFSSTKKGDSDLDQQLGTIRQARDGMAAQVNDLQRKVARLEDEVAELTDNRDAAEAQLDAARTQVRELQSALEATGSSAADAAKVSELDAELGDIREKLAATERDRDASACTLDAMRDSLDAAEEQLDAVSLNRDTGAQQIAALEAQLKEQRAEAARLTQKLGESESRQSESAQLTRQFDQRRLDMIELATQLENAQREIRNLSASLAEARLEAKLSGAKRRTSTQREIVKPKTEAIHPAAAADGSTRIEASDRAHLLALREAFRNFSHDQRRLELLKEMASHARGIARETRDEARPVLRRVSTAFANLLGDLHEVPEQISEPRFATINQAIGLIALLLADPAVEQSVNLDQAQIYVVDDESATCGAVVEAMDAVGLQANFALYSGDAIAQLAGNRYDLILLDVHMPEQDGFEVCSNIRNTALHAETPIFFITGNPSVANRAQSSLRGGTELIAKPFNFQELGLKALQSVITSQLKAR